MKKRAFPDTLPCVDRWVDQGREDFRLSMGRHLFLFI